MAHYDAIIIGGGAAGLMAAWAASQNGKRVLLLEKNKLLGKKLLITGKGRCNVTNNCTTEEFMSNIPSNAKFLYSAYSRFSCIDAMRFFEEHGVKLKTERGNRVFPESDKAKDIVLAFERALKNDFIEIKNDRAKELIIENGGIKGVKCENGEYFASSVLVATGG
ncbi:MAG TPA: FAD-dependent oxidoreductase, partial [Oscillospiraceae bacterium]|nr:FAD-dependent oxidoreductase [Oscillospiraceae bacterium]